MARYETRRLGRTAATAERRALDPRGRGRCRDAARRQHGSLGSGAGDSGLGLLGMLGDFASMTLLAGAGMLGATWAGVGSTVDAWLGSSVTNWAVALMLVAGLAFLCQRTVRRARVSVRRD